MIAGRSPWLCQGTTPPGAMVNLRRRSMRFSILAGSSARLIAASTLSVTPLAGLESGFLASAIILSAGHCPANAAGAVPAARTMASVAMDLYISLSRIGARDAPCFDGGEDRGIRLAAEISDGSQVHRRELWVKRKVARHGEIRVLASQHSLVRVVEDEPCSLLDRRIVDLLCREFEHAGARATYEGRQIAAPGHNKSRGENRKTLGHLFLLEDCWLMP